MPEMTVDAPECVEVRCMGCARTKHIIPGEGFPGGWTIVERLGAPRCPRCTSFETFYTTLRMIANGEGDANDARIAIGAHLSRTVAEV